MNTTQTAWFQVQSQRSLFRLEWPWPGTRRRERRREGGGRGLVAGPGEARDGPAGATGPQGLRGSPGHTWPSGGGCTSALRTPGGLPPHRWERAKIDFLASFLAIAIDADATFTSLIVHVINQILLLKGATESCCARGELAGSQEGLATAPRPVPALGGKQHPPPQHLGGRGSQPEEKGVFSSLCLSMQAGAETTLILHSSEIPRS